MLETEISQLRAEISQLRESVNGLTATLLGVAHAAIPTIINIPTVLEPAPQKPMPVDLPQTEPKEVSVDELQAFCTDACRKDPDLKSKIKAIIATFDGAKTLNKVPAHRLPELKAALEALV